MTVADRIKLLRERLGLTQEQLAERLGYNGKSSISKIETSGNDITLKKISRLAPVLHTTEAYLMGWEDSPAPSDKPTKIVKVVSQSLREYANDDTEETYYTNDETAEMAQTLFDNEDMRLLFDAAKDSRPEDLKMAADMLNRLKRTNLED